MCKKSVQEQAHISWKKLLSAWGAEAFLFIPLLLWKLWSDSPFPAPCVLGAVCCLLCVPLFRRNRVFVNSLMRVFSLYVKMLAWCLLFLLIQPFASALWENGVCPAIISGLYLAFLPMLMAAFAVYRMAEMWVMRKTPSFFLRRSGEREKLSQ